LNTVNLEKEMIKLKEKKMRKHFFYPLITMAAFGLFSGCQSPSGPIASQGTKAKIAQHVTYLAKSLNTLNGVSTCGTADTLTLWAGKTINVGTVVVANDDSNLYVTYTTTGSWDISATHLNISTQPFTARGAPGQYLYQSTNPAGTQTYTYTVPITWTHGTALYFLAHADVTNNGSGSTCQTDSSSSDDSENSTNLKSEQQSSSYDGGHNLTKKKGGYSFDDHKSEHHSSNQNKNHYSDNNNGGHYSGGDDEHHSSSGSCGSGSTSGSGDHESSGGDDESGSTCQTETAMAGTVVIPANGSWYATFSYTIQMCNQQLYSISGVAFYDANINGVQDANETGIANVTIVLSNGATTTTDANGNYSFGGLTVGVYTVTGGTVQGDAATTNSSAQVIITNADAVVSFGYITQPAPL
jgi:hypothetical protein